MTFSEEIKSSSQPIINQIYQDHFIQDLLRGSLSENAIKQYLRADASYLKEFTNLYALLIPKVNTNESVKFLVNQIQFTLDGEVAAHEVLAQSINQSYEDIVKEKVWPPSGDHYIKHMYYHAYAHENAAYTIAAMAPCPYVYEEIAKKALADSNLNRDSITYKWFEFYSTEMRPLIKVFDKLLDDLTMNSSNKEKQEIKESFLQSTIHEKNFFNMAYTNEKWNYGGVYNEQT